jgi:hypothetical protein
MLESAGEYNSLYSCTTSIRVFRKKIICILARALLPYGFFIERSYGSVRRERALTEQTQRICG